MNYCTELDQNHDIRMSSCMTARGVWPVPYPVHGVSCWGGVGGEVDGGGVPILILSKVGYPCPGPVWGRRYSSRSCPGGPGPVGKWGRGGGTPVLGPNWVTPPSLSPCCSLGKDLGRDQGVPPVPLGKGPGTGDHGPVSRGIPSWTDTCENTIFSRSSECG